MLKRFLFVLILVLSFISAEAQFDTSFVKTRLLTCADSLAQGFRTRNWELYSRYTNPAVIGALGGREAFIAYVNGMFGPVPDSAWKYYQPGKILQVVRSAKDLQAVIELHSLVEWQGIRVTATAYLIGESWNGGYTWTFFDSQGDKDASRIINPGLSDELVIPAKNEKVEPLVPPGQNKPPLKPKN